MRARRPEVAQDRWRQWRIIVSVLFLGCLGLLALSVALGAGSVTLSLEQAWRAITAPQTATKLEVVATNARFSRALMAMGVGMALGAAGALLQALYRNPLADPGITGVTQGAVTAAVLWVVFGPPMKPGQVAWLLPAVSAVGAAFSALLTWTVTRLGGKVEPIRLILMGVLVGGVLSAFTSIALLWTDDDNAQMLISWLSGSLASATWDKLLLFAVALAVTMPLVLIAIPRANLLQLGDEVTSGLGQSPTPARILVLVASCLLTAAAVCTVGGVGFVGLIAPHLLRWRVGSDLRRLVPVAALAGAWLVMISDFVARNLRPVDVSAWLGIPLNLYATTLPVGVYMALLGGPFFLIMLRRTRS